MNALTVKTNSVAANLVNADAEVFRKLNRELQAKRLGEITLLNDKARFYAASTKTISIPAKALRDSESLYAWLLERIGKLQNWKTYTND